MQLKNSKIKSIKKIENQDRYNLEIKDNHNYFANNILVHNCRCLAVRTYSDWILYSRQLKVFSTLSHIKEFLSTKDLPVGTILDGELYSYGIDFQNIISAVKRDSPNEKTKDIQYWLYDVIQDRPYKDRFSFLLKHFDERGIVRVLKSLIVNSVDEVISLHKRRTSQGFEGVMLRNMNDKGYEAGRRSFNLEKVKSFLDDEFPIVGVEPCKGKMTGMCAFILQSPKGQFKAMPEGNEEHRRQLYQDWLSGNIKEGELATVRYFSLTLDGIPRFPIMVGIRNFE